MALVAGYRVRQPKAPSLCERSWAQRQAAREPEKHLGMFEADNK